MNTSLSIIIPALNEEHTLPGLLKMLGNRADYEIILVDGGSTDATCLLAEGAHCITISSPPGRSLQMNLGAQAASGEVLLFLHADTKLPENFLQLIQNAIQQPHFAAGAFSLKIEGDSKRLALIARFANLRSRYLRLPYGDQAIFLWRTTFLKNGGFPKIEIMEDFVFIKNLRKTGAIITLPEPVTTSARRWQNMGILRTTLINQLIIFGFYLGIQPVKLASFYKRIRGIQKTAPNTTHSG